MLHHQYSILYSKQFITSLFFIYHHGQTKTPRILPKTHPNKNTTRSTNMVEDESKTKPTHSHPGSTMFAPTVTVDKIGTLKITRLSLGDSGFLHSFRVISSDYVWQTPSSQPRSDAVDQVLKCLGLKGRWVIFYRVVKGRGFQGEGVP